MKTKPIKISVKGFKYVQDIHFDSLVLLAFLNTLILLFGIISPLEEVLTSSYFSLIALGFVLFVLLVIHHLLSPNEYIYFT